MLINQTVVDLAVAKRDIIDNSDLDNEYEETMEEIESRKKTCKALEYAGHVTGLVTDLAGDIPEIPLVTDTAKVVSSGVSAVAHVAEFGMNIAATAMECDDVNFDEIKAIMEKRFSEIDRKLDHMSEAMEKVTEMVTKSLISVEQTRQEMNWGFKTVLATLKNREVESIFSKINKFARYFEEKRNEISKLPTDQFVFRLREKDGILDYLKKVRKPEGLHSDLFELMDPVSNYAIPENANDTKAFQALYALFYGTQIYVSVMFFLLKQHSYLADYYYQKGRDKEFNTAFDILVTSFNEFKTSLTGNRGLINEVVKTLDKVKNKDFIKDVKDELYKEISKRSNTLRDLKSKITHMVLNVIEDIPEMVLDIDFDEKNSVPSNYGDWDDKTKVRYAVQLRVNGTYSKLSEWTEPLKVEGKANPTLKVPRDEKGRERLIFRKFNDEKPQLAGILTNLQEEFHDIHRDLYNAARSKDESKPLEYIPKLIEAGALTNATFEMNRNVMHAAAESGNVLIAMRFFLSDAQELLNAADEKGFTPMHVAAITKNAGFVNFLIDQKAEVNAQTKEDKLTPLHLAAKRGYLKTVKNLISSNKIDINKPEKSGYTPLHYAVRGLAPTIKILLESDKILINAKSDFGLTPFHLAVMKGDRDVCDALLNSGKVDVNAKNKENMTPLHFAAMTGNADMIQYLLSGKTGLEEINVNAVTSDNNWTPLYMAIYFKQTNAALELLKSNTLDLNIASKEKYAPLHLSVATGQVAVFDELLKRGSDLEALTRERFTALHLAALRPETDFTSKLLDQKANIDAIADDGSTPLHLAAKADKTDQILLLVRKGASMKLYDSKNFLAMQYCIKNMNLEALQEATKHNPDIISYKTEEGQAMKAYAIEFVFGIIYHYHKNKNYPEYRKYKGLSSLEIFKKLGYYDLLNAVVDDPNDSSSVGITINAADKLAKYCMGKESDPKELQCSLLNVRPKRSIESLGTKRYYPSSKSRPLKFFPYAGNALLNRNGPSSLAAEATASSKSFSNAENSMVQGADTNSMLLLMNLFVRKLTNEKYAKTLREPTSSLESQATALNIVDKVSDFVDSVSGVPADELVDLAKLHSDIYKSIEGEKSYKIFDIVCEFLQNIANIEQIAALLSGINTGDSDEQNQENPIDTIAKYCLSASDNAP